jgi:hypothetical protein
VRGATWLGGVTLAFTCCNPFTGTGRLPPARCQVDLDCARGESCVQGVCGRAGWMTGHLRFADPRCSDPGRLRLVVADTALGGMGILPVGNPDGGEVLADVPASAAYRIEGLPRGRLTLFAICRDSHRVAGMVAFVIDDDRRGYRPGMGLGRDVEIDLAVDPRFCGD